MAIRLDSRILKCVHMTLLRLLLFLNVRQTHISRFAIIITKGTHFALCTWKSLSMQQRLLVVLDPRLCLHLASSHLKLLSLLFKFMAHNFVSILRSLLQLSILALQLLDPQILLLIHLSQKLHVLVCLSKLLFEVLDFVFCLLKLNYILV